MRTRKFQGSKSYEKNLLQAKTDQRCIVCGRDVKDPPGYLHLIEGGSKILHPSDEEKFLIDIETDEELECGDLGLHPVGSTCAKYYVDWLLVFEN